MNKKSFDKQWQRNFFIWRKSYLIGVYDGKCINFFLVKRNRVEEMVSIDFENCAIDDNKKLLQIISGIRNIRVPFILRLEKNLACKILDRLPKASRTDIQKIVENRIEIMTPWSAEQSIFMIQTIVSDKDRMVNVTSIVVPKHIISKAMLNLEKLDLFPDAIDVVNEESCDQPTYNLLDKNRKSCRSRFIGFYFYIGCIVILGIGVMFNVQAKQMQNRALKKHFEVIEKANLISDLPNLYIEARKLKETQNYVSTRFLETLPTISIVNSISLALPDSAFLESLTIEGQEIVVSGYSQDAAALVLVFNASPIFNNVRLVNQSERSLVRDEDDSFLEVESFLIRFSVQDAVSLH